VSGGGYTANAFMTHVKAIKEQSIIQKNPLQGPPLLKKAAESLHKQMSANCSTLYSKPGQS
jgi:hypothetical protein